MKKSLCLLIVLLIACFYYDAKGQAGANDTTFNPTYQGFDPGTGANNSVLTTSIQSDGKIIIGGSFTSFNGTTRRRIARLNTDGSVDILFNPGTGAGPNNTIVYTTSIQSDGKIIIAGSFSTFNQVSRSRIARLNTDGSHDASFNPGTGASYGSSIYTSDIQSDGKIIIGGDFTSFNGTAINRIARLNTDGSLDANFSPGSGANNNVYSAVIQGDGKIIIGGSFTTFNSTSRNRIARLNSDGSLDTSFDPGTGASGTIRSVALQSDGKIIITGNFTSYNGTNISRVARLNSDGSLDATFIPGSGANDYVRKAIVQGDGKIVIGGDFSTFNTISRLRIARLNSDGSIDAAFNPGTGANNSVRAGIVKSDGKIIIGGDFTLYDGTSRNYFARLNSDGSLDTTCLTCSGANEVVRSTAVQNDGKIIIGGYFTFFNGAGINRIARLESDGSLDASFNPGQGPDGGVTSVALQSDGKVFIAGDFNSYDGTLINRIARLNTNGSLDTTFAPDTGANNVIYALAVQSDGKVLIGGDFDSVNETPRNRIARLNSDGSLDATFNPGTGVNYSVYFITIQGDGKIIIGGSFTSYNGSAINYLARLNSDGSLDATFTQGTGANNYVRGCVVQGDSKIIIAGSFTSYNGTTRNRIARLNTDGSLDASFDPGTGAASSIYSLSLQSDGKILIGGVFTTFNGTSRIRFARLNNDGSLDGTFNPGTGANSIVYTISSQNDGKIIIGGGFVSYYGADRNRIARVLNATIVGIPENINVYSYSLFPNPANGIVQLVSDHTMENATIKLWDVQGRLIIHEENVDGNKYTFDLTNSPNGIYFIEISEENSVSRLKAIKD